MDDFTVSDHVDVVASDVDIIARSARDTGLVLTTQPVKV